MYLVSIDPGSSSKDWAVWQADGTDLTSRHFRGLPIAALDDLVGELCDRAAEGPVALALDAPIRAFGGTQAPNTFSPPGAATGVRSWPFNVNPFSQRACEKALASRPATQLSSLRAPALADAIGRLCGWSTNPRETGNSRFVDLHPGVSVQGYMGAPHAPVVRTFLERLGALAAERGLAVVYAPWQQAPAPNTVYVLESHPAVTLGFYCSMGIAGFPARLPVYKGSAQARPTLETIGRALADYLLATYETAFARPQSDDELDALVGFDNLLKLAANKADIFGTVEGGYFLVPKSPFGDFTALWREADLRQ